MGKRLERFGEVRNVLVLRSCLENFKFNEGCGKVITFVDVPASFC